MHWRTRKSLIILKELVEKTGTVKFPPNLIQSKFKYEFDWYKYGKPILDSFLTLGIIEIRRNERGVITTHIINLEKIKAEGIEIENYLLQFYYDAINDEKEKSDHENKQDLGRLKLAKPEVKQ